MKRIDYVALLGYSVLAVVWFLPVLAAGRLLGPGDGLVESIPNYLVNRTLWEPRVGTGYPAAADPITFTWYPLAALLSPIPHSYNAFVIAAYVLASWFTYLFVSSATGSRFAGWISGLLYGFSGFLMAHAGHLSMIHTAAWIPAVLLGVERMRAAADRWWFAFGCFAVGNLVLAGHPQIMVYGLAFAALYAVASGSYRFRTLAMFACGIGLSAVLLVPLLEFTRLTVREHVTFDVFNSYHLPIQNLSLMLFPFLFGGEEGSIFGERWSVETERDVFLGLTALLLASLVFVAGRRLRRAPAYFFAVAATMALLLALGGDTPFGKLLFHVPGFNQFRAQSRFLVIFQLSMAVLAGFGVQILMAKDSLVRRRVAWMAGALLFGAFVAAFAISHVFATRLHNYAAFLGFPDVYFDLSSASLAVPLVVSCLGAIGIALVAGHGPRTVSMVLLSVLVIGELSSFGLFASWRYYSPSWKDLEPPRAAAIVQPPMERLVTVRGFLGKRAELPPNLSKLWGLSSLGKYGSLAIERYHTLLEMDSGGSLYGPWWTPGNRTLDLAGARYVFAGAGDLALMSRFQRVPVPPENLGEDLGEPAFGGVFRQNVSLRLDSSKSFTTVALVSYLRESIEVPQDAPVMELRLKAVDGNDVVLPVRAGRETADLFAECPSLATRMKHRVPAPFSTGDAVRETETCKAHHYFAAWPLAAGSRFASLELKWLPSASGIQILKLWMWNKSTGELRVLSGADFYPDRFQEIATHQSARIYRNSRAMPRAWLVPEVLGLTGEQVVRAIRTSRLPGGRLFDPAKTALVEDPAYGRQGEPDPAATAQITSAQNSVVEIRAQSRQASFLVLGDLYYPSWTATIDGAPVPIIQTNYIQRGVPLPAGAHNVRFAFRPASLCLGLAITSASLCAIALYVLRH